MSIFCVGGGEFFRFAQNPPPPTQNIDTRAVTDKCNRNNNKRKPKTTTKKRKTKPNRNKKKKKIIKKIMTNTELQNTIIEVSKKKLPT